MYKNLKIVVFLASFSFAQSKWLEQWSGNIPIIINQLIESFNQAKPFDFISNGFLLAGKPGDGKTLIANILSEVIPQHLFFYCYASDLNRKQVIKLFEDARNAALKSPTGQSVIFIDDSHVFCDSGSKKGETRDNLLALENELDGIRRDDKVIVILASNKNDMPQTLTRSGRIDERIDLNSPSPDERIELIINFAKGINAQIDQDIDFKILTAKLFDFSVADLKRLTLYANVFSKNNNEKPNIITKINFLGAALAIYKRKCKDDINYIRYIKAIEKIIQNKNEPKGFQKIVGNIPQEIKDLVSQISNTEEFDKYGVKLPKGIIFTGPPGTGKTTLARAIAEEAGCEFVVANGSEFIGGIVGSGAQRIKEVFEEAKSKAALSNSGKTIIFIDEIDAIGKRQGNTLDSTITELLTQMDGFEEDPSIIVIAASNNPGNLDAALLRAGRFSKKIEIGLPDEETRIKLIDYYANLKINGLNQITLEPSVSLEKLGKATNNFSPAEIAELLQRVKTIAMHEKANYLEERFFVESIKNMLQEKSLQGQKDTETLIDQLDVIFNGKASTKGFAGLAGEIEPEIADLVKMLNGELDPVKYGLPYSKGILLVGPPGTGKTAIARALAQESGCGFINAKATEFINKYVGVGADNIRNLFNEARKIAKGNKNGKCIIFIDEIDAIGVKRGNAEDGGAREQQQALNELLTQMDGFSKDDSVIVLAATNKPDVLDAALVRAGRFDTIVTIGLPNNEKRKALFQFYAKDKPVSPDMLFDQMAAQLEGYSAADISNVINKAAKIAMKSKSQLIEEQHFNLALQEIIEAELAKGRSHV
jgi:ATP-dependent 26S proteasome regulatory subunit